MTRLRDMTAAERIVWVFENRVTEAHRSAFCNPPLSLTEEQVERAMPRAREIAHDRGITLTPMYDKGCEGWWTSEPTRRLVAIACVEEAKRNRGAWLRNAACYRLNGKVIAEATLGVAAQLGGSLALLESIPDYAIGEHSDWVVDRVRAAASAGRGFVARDDNKAAA